MSLYQQALDRQNTSGSPPLSNIPVTNQDAGFRVLEQFQYKAHLCSNGYSLTNRCNNVVMLLKRFFDGVKITLYGVK